MALFPIQAEHRTPVGLFPLKADESIEGGNVVYITGKSGATYTAEIAKWADSDLWGVTYGEEGAYLGLIGLFDDSTTGTGYGAGYLGSVIGQGATEISGATVVGPNTTLGSAKGTVWLEPGLYMTDQFDADRISDTTPVGTPLFSGDATVNMTVRGTVIAAANTTGIITTESGVGAENTIIGQLLAFIDQPTDLLASRVQPKPSGAKWKYILFHFK